MRTIFQLREGLCEADKRDAIDEFAEWIWKWSDDFVDDPYFERYDEARELAEEFLNEHQRARYSNG